jgi:hypothetical protein
VVSGNSKYLFTCRKMTKIFISVNQQILPFPNGPSGKARRGRLSEHTLLPCSVSGKVPYHPCLDAGLWCWPCFLL